MLHRSKSRRGQSTTEYGLLLILVCGILIFVLPSIGLGLSSINSAVNSSINSAIGGGGGGPGPVPPSTGNLTITKSIVGAPDGYTGSFDFSVACTGISPLEATIDTANSFTATVTGIPLTNGTSSCTVTETPEPNPPTGYNTWITTYSPSGGITTVTATTPGAVTVTNTTSLISPPAPSGDVLLGITAITAHNSFYSNPLNANDGNDATGWEAWGGSDDDWWEADLGTPTEIGSARVDKNPGLFDMIVEYSSDGITWNIASTHLMETMDDTWTFTPQTAQYWRFRNANTDITVYTFSLFGI